MLLWLARAFGGRSCPAQHSSYFLSRALSASGSWSGWLEESRGDDLWEGDGKDGQNGDLCLPIIPLDVAQSFPHSYFSTAAEIQLCGKSCNINVATSPAVAPRINHMWILFRSISLGATLTWCFITRTTIIELSCGLPSAKHTTDLLLHCPSLYSGMSLYHKRHEYPIQSERHLHGLFSGFHFS